MTSDPLPSAPLIVTLLLTLSRDTEALTGTIYNVDPAGSGAPYGAGDIVQYVHYTSDVVYNQARAVCRTLGGDLAKIETSAKQTWIRGFSSAIFDTNHLWTALVEDVQGTAIWVSDCSEGISDITISGDWASDKQCVILMSGTSVEFDRKSCDGDYAMFLCELRTAKTSNDLNVNPAYTTSADPDAQCYASSTSAATTTTSTTVSSTTSPASTSTSTTAHSSTTITTTSPTSTDSSATTHSSTPASSSTTPTAHSSTPLETTSPTSSSTTITAHSSTPLETTSPTSSSTTTTPHSSTPIATTSSCVSTSGSICLCVQLASNVSEEMAMRIAKEISKNLTVDAKKTSSHRRTLTFAEDSRPSSKYIAVTGAIMVATPFVCVFISDLLKAENNIKDHRQKRQKESTA